MKHSAVQHKAWSKTTKPQRILAIRFQALGDLMITLPYLQSLKEQIPDAHIHLLTRREVREIPKNLVLFKKVISIAGGRNAKIQFGLSLLLIPYLWLQNYDVVIDLQNHRISRIIRKLLFARVWSEFDRSSKILAGQRAQLTIDALQIVPTTIATSLQLKKNSDVEGKLRSNGWDGKKKLIVLNPAGAFTNRNWSIESYILFSQLWIKRHPSSQFLILGLNSLKTKADYLKKILSHNLIDFTGSTSILEAFVMVKLSALMLTEDSGLMHMAWIQGVPTLALFGSSPSYWSAPMGGWSRCLNSADLPCGDCFANECKFGDVHCLTRFTPQRVIDEAESLLDSIKETTTLP
jgi:heptosyltransferase II